MSKDDIEKMRQEAEKFTEQDKEKKETIEIRNKAESLIFQSEKTLKDAGDKVSDDIKKPVQEKIDALKKILEDKKTSAEDLSKAYEALSAEIQKVGAELYNRTSEADSKNATEGSVNKENSASPSDDDGVKVYNKDGKKTDDGTVEAEVVEEKGKKKKK